MNYSDKYSICFQPSEDIIEVIKDLKLELSNHIGWYNSKNSLAHLTIAEFQANEAKIELIDRQLNRLIPSFEPITVHLDTYSTYANGTFLLQVNEPAHSVLKGYVKQISQALQLKNAYICTTPHLTIGRKLDQLKIEKAMHAMPKQDLQFICNHIVLRRLNLDRKQFDCIRSYSFLALPSQEPQQLTLF